MKTTVIVSGLLLILVANLIMVYYAPYGLSPMENFQNNTVMPVTNDNANGNANGADAAEGFKARARLNNHDKVEGFDSFYLENAGGAREHYSPVGAFDGVKLSTGNNVSGWRYTAPNEPLTGPEFEPGADSLFMFKNNQCKPECCPSSYTCSSGCVCTTAQQRDFIASRGGNRNTPTDL